MSALACNCSRAVSKNICHLDSCDSSNSSDSRHFLPTRTSGPSCSSSRKVCLCVCLFVPFPCNFLQGWTGAEHASSVDWCGSCLALAWNAKNGEVFRIGQDFFYQQSAIFSTMRPNWKLFSSSKLPGDWTIQKLHGSHHCWMSGLALD